MELGSIMKLIPMVSLLLVSLSLFIFHRDAASRNYLCHTLSVLYGFRRGYFLSYFTTSTIPVQWRSSTGIILY